MAIFDFITNKAVLAMVFCTTYATVQSRLFVVTCFLPCRGRPGQQANCPQYFRCRPVGAKLKAFSELCAHTWTRVLCLSQRPLGPFDGRPCKVSPPASGERHPFLAKSQYLPTHFFRVPLQIVAPRGLFLKRLVLSVPWFFVSMKGSASSQLHVFCFC